jgi:release factor glutamine methyltransferase
VAEGTELQPEIAGYEPADALFGGPDGLRVIRRMVQAAAEVPLLVLEIGLGQGDEVEALVHAAGFRRAERVRDLAGIERVLIARR